MLSYVKHLTKIVINICSVMWKHGMILQMKGILCLLEILVLLWIYQLPQLQCPKVSMPNTKFQLLDTQDLSWCKSPSHWKMNVTMMDYSNKNWKNSNQEISVWENLQDHEGHEELDIAPKFKRSRHCQGVISLQNIKEESPSV